MGLLFFSKTPLLNYFKGWLMETTKPLQILSDMPNKILTWVDKVVIKDNDIEMLNRQLISENLVLKGKQQKLIALSIENVRLRELLNTSAQIEERVLLADLLAVSPNFSRHYIIINKGRLDGVFIGQAVIDQYGVYGQVIAVSRSTAKVLMLSDPRHAIPVKLARYGLKAILEGAGSSDMLTLSNITPTTDIKVGDIFLSSGLGGVFPEGYPVAEVVSIYHIEGAPYLSIKVKPFAKLDHSRQLLLLFKDSG